MYRQVFQVPQIIDHSFGALSGRLQFTVRRHKLDEDSLSSQLLVPLIDQFVPDAVLQ